MYRELNKDDIKAGRSDGVLVWIYGLLRLVRIIFDDLYRTNSCMESLIFACLLTMSARDLHCACDQLTSVMHAY